jgi:hypothetical protein
MKNKRRKLYYLLSIVMSVILYLVSQDREATNNKSNLRKINKIENAIEQKNKQLTASVKQKSGDLNPANEKKVENQSLQPVVNSPVQVKEVVMALKPEKQNPKAAKFKVEDGLVTVAGDIVLGVPKTADFPNQGWIDTPEFSIWESSEIPFHIQPALPNPERIYEAFEIFKDSPIHFVALTDQADAIVFEEKKGTCKSYVGKVGGLQPIWIGADCSATDIAHEILHALGFIHEQNRVDRDSFIEIVWDNIKEEYKYNFEMLPESFMKVSGSTGFDFNSLMIYPSNSFAKNNGLITLKAKQNSQIKPSLSLSLSDLERLQKFYGQ